MNEDAVWRELDEEERGQTAADRCSAHGISFRLLRCRHVVFSPENHSIWLVYGEMYTEPVADSFEGFMEKAVLD